MLADYDGPLKRLVRFYERDPQQQQDLYQEIALALWTAFPKFRGESSERTWLYRIANNVASTFRYQAGRRNKPTVQAQAEEPADERLGPDGLLDEAQRRRLLLNRLRRLPTLDFQIVSLHLESLSNEEIAEVVGLTAPNVATRLTRLRKKLAAEMAAREGVR
jgi:RNA polymerase sigma-70 factor (ECF subfamily)